MAFDFLEVFLGIYGGGAFGENVQRIGRDDVVFVIGGHDVMTSIIVDNPRLWIVQYLVVLLGEIFGGKRRDDGLDLADRDAFNSGIAGERSGRDSGAETDSQNALWIGMQDRR